MRKIVIDPRVIKHLGRDLITSPEVAIIELIKNSIDAKASHINLRLYNSMPSNELIPDCVSDSVPNKYLASPILVVEDDGCGMTDATIDGGFLKIATDIKSNEKSTLGEKGIGRLAAQRLGTALLVETSSDKENHTSYVFIDWNAVINGVVDIPSCDGPNTLHHTRLFIFNTNLEDYIDNATQFRQVSLDTTAFQVQVNRELKSALNFLITPFADAQDTPFIPQIKFYFDEHEVDITFPYDTLALAESIHNFRFEPTEDGMLNYGLNIKPWFIERVHRALVKAEAFKRLKKPHSFYRDILERNSTRIENTLKATATKDELVSLFYNILCDFYAVAEDEDKKLIFDSFIEKKALSAIEELLKIAPITGSIYSFKQGAAIGDKIIIDAAYDLGETSKRYSLKELKYFLEDYNGIKLYRDIFRIGFLGNKESDWIKLQQFRTKGQQWYRFDLGNTVGYVSLADAGQNHIQEISSRLDISANETSEAFKLLINVVFNYLFYDLNRKANDLVKTLLAEEGLLEENLSKRVKKNDAALREMMRRNKRMQKALADVSEHLRCGTQISGTDQVALPQQSYAFLTDTVRKLDADIKEDSSVQESTAVLLSEADAQLKAIEVESYNNYKLLLQHTRVDQAYKSDLKKELLFFSNVDTIDPTTIRWSAIRFQRNNNTYRMLISLCQLILEGMLLTTESGEYHLASFIDEQRMNRLYEKFILEYYAKECPQVTTTASQIPWALDDGIGTMLPVMQSDIMLTRGNEILIIDAKYYTYTMQAQYDVHTLHSGNLYQIFTYVKNKEAEFGSEPHQVSGMLLYAATDEAIQPDNRYRMSGNQISVKTLDLNRNFLEISAQLNHIVEDHFL